MLSVQQLEDCSNFLQESKLKQLASSDNISIVYIHGTARSGSTIAEIVLAQLADLAIHQPFRGTLQKLGGRFRTTKLDLDVDVYDPACGLIVRQIEECLKTKDKITVVIKELAGFFQPYIWQRWLKIPNKFLFTMREPHLQYMSWLAAMTDKVFRGNGTLQGDRKFVIDKAEITEGSLLTAEWSGTTLSCNQAAWNALIEDFYNLRIANQNNNQKIAILDSILLRHNPAAVVKNAIARLGFESEKLSLLNLNNLAKTKSKVQDIRDKTRPMVRKANSSNSINPLIKGESVSLNLFPQKSQQHIKSLIPLYLDFLYADEQVYLPSLKALENVGETGLIATHPFVAYAIAIYHLQDRDRVYDWFKSKGQEELINSFQDSFAVVNDYWEKKQKNYG